MKYFLVSYRSQLKGESHILILQGMCVGVSLALDSHSVL